MIIDPLFSLCPIASPPEGNDAVNVVDTLNASIAKARLAADTVSTVDSVVTSKFISRSLSDVLVVTDVGLRSLEVPRVVSDSISTTDITITPFNPALVSLSGWWASSYSGTPWVGTASLGSSSSRNLTTGGGAIPGTGVTLNSLTVADFDGSNDAMSNVLDMSNFLSLTGWTAAILFQVDAFTSSATNANPSSNAGLMAMLGNNHWGFTVGNPSGIGTLMVYQFDTSTPKVVSAPISTGTWYLAHATFNGTSMSVTVNNVNFSVSVGQPFNLTGTLLIGDSPFAAPFFNGQIAEIVLTNTANTFSYADIASYCTTKYALSLF